LAILAETWYFSITPGVLRVSSSFSIVEILWQKILDIINPKFTILLPMLDLFLEDLTEPRVCEYG